jgi:hypothetical protein
LRGGTPIPLRKLPLEALIKRKGTKGVKKVLAALEKS